jgi:hypothetical protein
VISAVAIAYTEKILASAHKKWLRTLSAFSSCLAG